MTQPTNAAELFPEFFVSGDMYRCATDFFLIRHPKLAVPMDVSQQAEYTCYFILTRGWVRAKVDNHRVELTPNTSAVVLGKQHVKLFDYSDDMDAVVYIFSRRIADIIFVKEPLALYREVQKNPVIQLSEYGTKAMMDTIQLIEDVLVHPAAEQMLDICGMLASVSFRLASPEHLWKVQSDAEEDTDRARYIMSRFTAIAEKHYRKHRGVRFYADQMCITPKYLSTCVKQASGHTANWWINSFVLRDAGQMLVYNNMSVKAVAAQLGFDDQILFGKYFKRQMGMSPSEYKVQKLKVLGYGDSCGEEA